MAFRDQCVRKVEMKSWAVLGAKFYVRASYQEKTGKGSFAPTPILNRIKYIYIYVYDMINFLYYDMNKKITQELCFKLIWSNWLPIRLKALQQQLISVISFSTFTP